MTNEDKKQLKESLCLMGADVSEDGNLIVIIAKAIIENEVVRFPRRGSTDVGYFGYVPTRIRMVDRRRNKITLSPMKVNPNGFVRKLNEDLDFNVVRRGKAIMAITGKMKIIAVAEGVQFGDFKECVNPADYGYQLNEIKEDSVIFCPL